MQSKRWQDKQITYGRLALLLLICVVIIGLCIVFILSIIGRINGAWAAIIGGILAVLTVLLAFLQWYMPRSPTTVTSTSSTSIDSSSFTSKSAMTLDSTLSKEDKAYFILLENLKANLTKTKGTLLIRVEEKHTYSRIYVKSESWLYYDNDEYRYRKYDSIGSHAKKYSEYSSRILQRTIEGYPTFVAIFENMESDTYTITYFTNQKLSSTNLSPSITTSDDKEESQPAIDTNLSGNMPPGLEWENKLISIEINAAEVTEVDARKLLPDYVSSYQHNYTR